MERKNEKQVKLDAYRARILSILHEAYAEDIKMGMDEGYSICLYHHKFDAEGEVIEEEELSLCLYEFYRNNASL